MTPKRKVDTEFITVSIRFTRELYEQMDALRKEDNRSFNQEVIHFLKSTVKEAIATRSKALNATAKGKDQ